MTQDLRPTDPLQKNQDQAKDSAEKESEPRLDLGLKSPDEEAKGASEQSSRQEAQGQKATQFNGNPNPQGAPRSVFKPKDETPMWLEKKEGPRDDQ